MGLRGFGSVAAQNCTDDLYRSFNRCVRNLPRKHLYLNQRLPPVIFCLALLTSTMKQAKAHTSLRAVRLTSVSSSALAQRTEPLNPSEEVKPVDSSPMAMVNPKSQRAAVRSALTNTFPFG